MPRRRLPRPTGRALRTALRIMLRERSYAEPWQKSMPLLPCAIPYQWSAGTPGCPHCLPASHLGQAMRRSPSMLGLGLAHPHCSRRALLARGGPVVGAVITAACGAAGTAPPSAKTLSDAPVTIEFYKRGTLQDADVSIMLQEWYERHPTWKV